MPSLDEDLARTFRAMAAGIDDHAAARVSDAVLAATRQERPRARRLGSAGIAAAVLAGAAASAVVLLDREGTGSPDPPPRAVDCLSGLTYSAETFVLLLGPEVGTVPPGGLLGAGTYGECPDGRGDEPVERDVFELPDVPPSQAVLVVDARGRGHVHLNVEEPTDGWDPDLQVLLDRWDVDR